jgi:hypothetical protein
MALLLVRIEDILSSYMLGAFAPVETPFIVERIKPLLDLQLPDAGERATVVGAEARLVANR